MENDGRLTHVEHGFGPVWDAKSRVLVLGSMPSPKSREASFYYMHPRNRFWPVMEAVFADPSDPGDRVGDTAESRRTFALRHHVALWDVIASCDIIRASDASIRNAVPNDIKPLLANASITHVLTTGMKAAQLYRRLIAPGLAATGFDVPMTPLPSTSPANASMNLARLTAVYRRAFRAAGLPVGLP
ncbi:DNA-deoxyinosine glycosylase [Bifidobacterium saguinibicoloris]|uniref:DNA-deoxyinosine glycosylase n=1 Tax=Bifidobacterium saguinibicoloris TaxID=2834433 RepID=UPI001C566B48|nr:DNA-deoxyinosine glycosylase [Bifidobacterium saguinibicoloris]MBW3080882.1 DNA-deoxyinosine glycosylase [Bifidobacterium saguinibicoloris]